MSKQTRISVNEARSLLREYSEALEVLAEATAKSVVRVGPHGDWGWRGGGTGFVSGPDGLIVTADHVVRRTRTPRISMMEGKSYEAKIIGRDPFTDVAVLKIDALAGTIASRRLRQIEARATGNCSVKSKRCPTIGYCWNHQWRRTLFPRLVGKNN